MGARVGMGALAVQMVARVEPGGMVGMVEQTVIQVVALAALVVLAMLVVELEEQGGVPMEI